MLKDIAITMLEEGKVLTEFEYRELENPTVRYRSIRRVFSRWPRVVSLLETEMPEVWAELTEEKKPAPIAPKPTPKAKPVAPKVKKPVVPKKPAPKVSVKKENEDE